jgi:uncharacterized protein YPO0396
MKSLTRMKMIQWHYFDDETVYFNPNGTIVTGDNGSGKSTIVDALQVILVGNMKMVKFNSSAHDEKTERNLVTYLRGKIGGESSTSTEYIRNHDFCSYLALEIEEENKNGSKTNTIIGVVFEYFHSSKEENHEFFIINDFELNDDLFYKEPGVPYTKDGFFRNLKQIEQYVGKLKQRKRPNINLFQRHMKIGKYQDDLRHLFGGIKDNFFSLLVKGISFSPITNLRKFFYEYILEENKIDVSQLKEYVETTEMLVQSIEATKKQIGLLNDIKEHHAKIVAVNNLLDLGNYMVNRAKVEKAENDIDRQIELLDLTEKQQGKWETERKGKEKEQKKLEDKKTCLQKEIFSHDVNKKEEELNKLLVDLEKEISEINIKNKNIKHKINSEILQRELLIESIKKYSPNPNIVSELENQQLLLNEVITTDGFVNLPSELQFQFAKQWLNGYEVLNNKLFELDRDLLNQNEEKNKLNTAIVQLKENQILPKDSPTVKLKKLILQDIHGIEVDILCEVIEVPNDKWKNAIEGFIFGQKFNLLVPPGYFEQALNIYESYKYSHKLESVGLVNIDKVIQDAKGPKYNSLAEEVVASKEYVKMYINYLLGDVIKCENVQELKNYRRSITPSCMVYQGYTARQIPEKNYRHPFIGKDAIERQLKEKMEKLKELKEVLRNLDDQIQTVKKVTNLDRNKQSKYDEWLNDWVEDSILFEKEELFNTFQNQLFSLDRSEIIKLESQVKNIEDIFLPKIKEEITKLGENIGGCKTKIPDIKEQIVKLKADNEMYNASFKNIMLKISSDLLVKAQERWNEEAKGNNLEEIITTFEANISRNSTRKANLLTPLIEKRTTYNNIYFASVDVSDESNNVYDEILIRLEETEIVKYEQQAAEANEKAKQIFIEDVVAKLKEQFEKAGSDANELNRVLRQLKFGTDQYTFRITPNNECGEYYSLLTDADLEKGYSLFTDSFYEKHNYIIDELYNRISNHAREENMDLLDYRTYLDFELEIKDDTGRVTKYSKVVLEKSGGETQVPFYVSILASFYNTYNMARKNNSLRLVIFDEAFNRMDANRVEEAVKFIQECGFQPIVIAPTGKVALLAPYFDNAQIVMKHRYKSFVVPISREELIEFDLEDEDELLIGETTSTAN